MKDPLAQQPPGAARLVSTRRPGEQIEYGEVRVTVVRVWRGRVRLLIEPARRHSCGDSEPCRGDGKTPDGA